MRISTAGYFVAMILIASGFADCQRDKTPGSQDESGTLNLVPDEREQPPAQRPFEVPEEEVTVPHNPDEPVTGSTDLFYHNVPDAMRENCPVHEDENDYVWDATGATQIHLQGTSIQVTGSGAVADQNRVTLVRGGTYMLDGKLDDGQIIVDCKEEEPVKLVLNGADITCTDGAPLVVSDAEKAVIILANGTENHLADGTSYQFEDPDTDEPNAALFSKNDLTIAGRGSLFVTGRYNDGIASKDGLIIAGGIIKVKAVDDGIRGKDYLMVKSGQIIVDAGGDGLKSDNDEDQLKGYVYIRSGTLDITSGGDAVQGQTDALVAGGNIRIAAGMENTGNQGTQASTKGIQADDNTLIDGGEITIDSWDDALHSNGNLVINGGTILLSTGDDAIHADSTVTINKGTIRITSSYEGIESQIITINDGDIHLVSSDDGLNAAGGDGGFGMGRPGGPGGGPPQGGGRGFRGGGRFGGTSNFFLYLNGGTVVVDAMGDGIDINGSVVMTGGELIVNGPTADFNSALDYNGSFTLSGGFLVAAGSSRMAQVPDNSSTQPSLLLNFRSAQQAGTLFHLGTSNGDFIFSFMPSRRYQSIVFSSPDLKQGVTYEAYIGGSSMGKSTDGLYKTGTYRPGTKYTSFSLSGNVTRIYE